MNTTYKQKVKQIYPTAEYCSGSIWNYSGSIWIGGLSSQVNAFYGRININTYLLGFGRTENLAWKNSWLKIKNDMLTKFQQ